MEYCISAFWIGLELLCAIFFCGAFLSRKPKKKYQAMVIAAVWLFVVFYSYFPIKDFVKQILLVSVFISISLLLYEGRLLAHFFLAVLCYIFIATIDVIAINGACLLLDISYDDFIWEKFNYTILTTADKLIAVLFSWLLSKFRIKGNLGRQHSKWLFLSTLFPTVSMVMFLMFFYQASRYGGIPISIILFGCILMVANIAMLYIVDNIEKATVAEQNSRLLKQQMALQAENYLALKKNYTAQRKSTHEFERHIQVLQDLLERQEYDSANDYVRKLQVNRSLKVYCINSNNPVIDVVLNQKHQLAQENGISMSVKVNDLSAIPIQPHEMVVLLSNLLDNAIEACLKVEGHREIMCTLLVEDSIYISVRNTSNPVNIVNGEIETTKANPAEHGFGIPAVKFILEHLNSEYTFEYKEGWFQFVAEIQI